MADNSSEMTTSQRVDRVRLLLSMAVGLTQGGVLYFASEAGDHPATAFVVIFAILAGTSFLLAFKRGAARLFLPPILLFSVTFALCAAWIERQSIASEPFSDVDFLFVLFAFGAFCAWYVFLPFVQAAIGEKRIAFPYESLFRHSWDNMLILAEAALTVGIFWALIGLWMALFDLLGVNFFMDLFLTMGFVLTATPTIFGAGVALARQRAAILNSLRHILFTICGFLAPMVFGIVFLFLGALLFTGLKPLWDTNMASLILLWTQATVIFFINSALQDRQSCPYARPLRLAMEGAALVLPIFTALIAYALALRIGQYGLTPDRILAVTATVILGVYALGYAAAVIIGHARKGPWLGFARPVNKIAAGCVILAALVLLSPILDPLALSARNQFDRLIRGKADPETFDFQAMRREYGPEGAALFSRLEDAGAMRDALRLAPKLAEAISQGVSRAKDGRGAATPLGRGDIAVFGDGALPDALFVALEEARGEFSLRGGDTLYVMPLDMNGDGEDEFLVVDSDFWISRLFARKPGGGYEQAGSYNTRGISRRELRAAYKEGRIRPEKPQFDDLDIAGNRLPFSR